MKRTSLSAGEVMMRRRLQRELAQQDEKAGRAWLRPGGGLERAMRVIYYSCAFFSLLVFTLNALIFWSMHRSGLASADAAERFFRSNRLLVAALAVVSVAALICMLCRKRNAAFALQAAAGCLLAVQLVQVAVGSYQNRWLLFGLYCALLPATLSALVQWAVAAAARRRLNMAAERETKKLFRRYAGEDDDHPLLREGEWEQMLLTYEQALAEGKKPPTALSAGRGEQHGG